MSDNRARAAHLLGRLGFGPGPGDVDRILSRGIDGYIEDQLFPEDIDDREAESQLQGLSTLSATTAELLAQFPEGQGARRIVDELATSRLIRAVVSRRQLEEVLVDFWFNHFNVYAFENFTRFATTSYEREAIRPHVFGRFRELLGATARHPAMLFYLDNWLSSVERVRRGEVVGGLNENYARELMELHTLGVDGGYSQDDVGEVARVFSGWTIDNPRSAGRFLYDPRQHEGGDKTVLGQRIPAGGMDEGERVLDLFAGHPSTARHVCRRLCQRLLADEPPESAVERSAATFRATGGDLRRVVSSIVTGPELLDPALFGVKAKTPLELVASSLRAVGARPRNWRAALGGLSLMGMPLYGAIPPTGYGNDGRNWMNASSLLSRMNFSLELVSGSFGLNPNLAALLADVNVGDPLAVGARVRDELFGGRLSQATWEAATKTQAGTAVPASTRVVGLLLASPEFQAR